MKIVIETIPHREHRPEAGDTVGDWYERDGVLNIKVSKLSCDDYEFLVAVHELVERFLCNHAGISEEQVDKFDKNWEEHEGIEEAGDDSKAPYHHQHIIAGVVERLVAEELGVNWNDYSDEVISL